MNLPFRFRINADLEGEVIFAPEKEEEMMNLYLISGVGKKTLKMALNYKVRELPVKKLMPQKKVMHLKP